MALLSINDLFRDNDPFAAPTPPASFFDLGQTAGRVPGERPGPADEGPDGERPRPQWPKPAPPAPPPVAPDLGGKIADILKQEEGGGGGGGGDGAPRPIGAPRAPAPQPLTLSPRATAFQDLLEKMIRDALAQPSRFSPEVLQSLYGEIARQASGQIARGERGVRAEAARRGLSRAGQTAAAIREVRAGAEAQRGQAGTNLQLAKVNADYQDRNAALDRAQNYLNSLRDSEYRLQASTEQRRQFDANLALAYAQLAQQRELLSMQLQSSWDMMMASITLSNLFQGAGR